MSEDEITYDASVSKPVLRDEEERAYVAVLEGAGPGIVTLLPGRPVTVGRSRTCAITVDDRAVSRLQASFTRARDGVVFVEDHGSRNGTFLEGRRVDGRAPVPSGQTVRVGRAKMTVIAPRNDGTAAASGRDRGFVAEDPATLAVVHVLERVAKTDATVLLLGETGAGKEVLTRFVHDASERSKRPFVAINCGSVPDALAESTLFGHERGAFTGALKRHAGVFEQAHGGTLFLDEVAELSAASQTRLLRVLEERRVTPVGARESIAVDVRIVAATHRDPIEEVRAGRFREDLLYRLDVVRVTIPALRERPRDIVPLAERFLAAFAPHATLRLSAAARERLLAAPWPGNVRQLRNAIQRAIALCPGGEILPEHLGDDVDRKANPIATAQRRRTERERDAIIAALEACEGNQTRAAERLGIARRTLIYKLEKYGLKPPPRATRDDHGATGGT